MEEKYERGEYDPWRPNDSAEEVGLVEAIEEFLTVKARSVRERTLDTYRQQLEAWVKPLPPGLQLRDVRSKECRPYVLDPSISNASKRKRYRHLRAFFNWADKQGYLDDSPLDKVHKPKKEKKDPAFLSTDDLERLLIAIDHHAETTVDVAGRTPDVQWLKDAIQIGVCTGLRRSELVNVRWSDIDLTHGHVVVRNREDFKSKSGHERRVPLKGDALDVIRRREAEREDNLDGPVLTDRRGLPVKPDRISKRFKFFVRKAKLDERFHFHSLRHTTASWLAMRGVPMRVIQGILGHSSVSVTEMYSHLSPEVMDKAMGETFGS
jgi:integrase